MLTPDQVIPFLAHDETFVRRHAAEYLADANDPSPATADDLWHAIDRHGMRGPVMLASYLSELPQTEQSLWRTMGALSGTLDEGLRDRLEDAVEWAGVPLLKRFEGELLAGLQLSDKAKSHIRRRIELAGEDVRKLWDRLMEEGRDRGDERGPDEELAGLLIEAIGERADDAVIAEAMAVLRDQNVTDWREVFAIEVAGAARHELAADLLMAKLRVDDDVTPERAGKALVRIGTAGVVEKLAAFLPNEDWYVRMYCLYALGQIKRRESEAVLLDLLDREKDQELRTLIGEGLCLLGAPPAVLARLRDGVAAGRLGAQFHGLEEAILAAGRMVGYEPPENKKWTERARQMDERIVQMREEWAREEEGGEDDVLPPPTYVPSLDPEVTWPIERTAPKVGRNDSCPCGSGKKYKKCCGRG